MRYFARILPFLACLAALASGIARSAEEVSSPSPPSESGLDVTEPPFGDHDFSWLNGSNRQPASLLQFGPVTFSVYVDGYYAFQFSQPIDHTIFQSTTAARHNEISLNLAAVGVEVGGAGSVLNGRYGGPVGRLYLQYGSTTETTAGQDGTTFRGSYLTQRAFIPLQQAAGGWHFPWLHGVNIEIGIFPSYVAMESYLPQENWNYTHAFVSDFTPYYFSGSRTQIYFARNAKLELWLVNNWQTFGQWHDTRAGGYLVNWRPHGWLSLTHSAYFGKEQPNDRGAVRLYTDNYLQWKYFQGGEGSFLRSLAAGLVADVGYEDRTAVPSGIMAGASLSHRFEFPRQVFATLRGDVFYDESKALVIPLPSPYVLPGSAIVPVQPWLGGGVALTGDYWPSPWLLLRLEYSHRWANQPYFSGHGGITGPGGFPPGSPATTFTPDLRRQDNRIIVNATLRL